MKSRNTFLICLMVLTLCVSCRLVDSLTKNESAGTVENLWSDVPALSGATKSEMTVPLGVRLMIRAAMHGKVNFIAFTTDKKPQEVQDFYSAERMNNAGWKADEKGCYGDTEGKESAGAMCFFTRRDNSKEEGLAIVLAEDKKSGQTDIFYARIDMTDENANKNK